VKVSVAKGYDKDYPWRQVGAGAEAQGGGYYLSAVEAGEPAGRWWGAGAQALGLEPGSVVGYKDHDLLFGQRRAPDGTKLRRAPGTGAARAHEAYERLVAAEPGALPGRRRELRMEAQRSVRQSPLYYDVTVSPSKSISVFHASLGENMREAVARGDAKDAAYWRACIEGMDADILAANNAALDYMQREAGYVRPGAHAARVNGQEGGKWLEADLAVASWYQHTSRDMDPQLHVHNQVAHSARCRETGKWLAPDSHGFYDHARAASAVAAVYLEEALTRRFGLQWAERPDGQGYEIAGVSQEIMDTFSSRRADIERRVREELVPRFEATYGRPPTQSELSSLNQDANLATREHKPEGVIDWDKTHAGWRAKLAQACGVDLASIARVATREHAATPRGELTQADVSRAAQKALAKASAEKASWTRADLLSHVGRMLPRTGADPAERAVLAEQVTDRALSGDFGPVACLEAPALLSLPPDLIRSDGQSVYTRHGSARYATRTSLDAEEHLVGLAGERGAPVADRELVAAKLGAAVEDLEAALAGRAADTGVMLPCGLRLDQAAALYHGLTSDERMIVINAAPGSGKTTTAIVAGRIWESLGREVVGVTPSQSSRDTLAAGIPRSFNFAQFLGHAKDQRGKFGPVAFGPGTLVIGDEVGMFSTPDLLDTAKVVSTRDSKMLSFADTEQLTAVEHGGGARLVAGQLGYGHLTEPVRFKARWEREASVRLRQGDAAVLTEYADHGRIRAGSLEEILDTTTNAYVARTLEGRDILLNVRDHATRRELNRRIRGELLHLGIVDAGRSAPLKDGQQASAGDLVFCTSGGNDSKQQVGEGLTLANGQSFRVESVTDDGRLSLRLVLHVDPETGARTYSDHPFTYDGREVFDLGYAVTTHAAQSRTVWSGMEVVTGNEDKQGSLVGLTRGTTENLAFVAVPSPRIADPKPGARPAPELERAARLESQHAGRGALTGDGRLSVTQSDERLEAALGVMAAVVERDGAELSALEYQQQRLRDADHLGLLNVMWQDQTWQANASRFSAMVAAAMPEGYDADSPQARWLHRTLRSAELAGLDPEQVLNKAVSSGSLAGSRDVASVVDARIRREIGAPVPLSAPAWSQQVPEMADPARQEFVRKLAQAMDGRRERIGEFAAAAALPWATDALGSVPDDPAERLEWQERAAAVGAYRETYGHNDPADAIGPEPAAGESPDKRAAWHDALRALGPVAGTDLRGRTDGQLWLMRDTYEAETAWLPKYVAPALGLVRQSAGDAAWEALRSDAEAKAAEARSDQAAADRHRARAAASRAKFGVYHAQEKILERGDGDYREGVAAIEPQLRLAAAADTLLRQRHPELDIPSLKSGAPEPVSDAERGEVARGDQVPGWVASLEEASAQFGEEMEARRGLLVPDEDPDYEPLGEAFPEPGRRASAAVLQPPAASMPPAPSLAEREAEAGV
jgi:conjugative relaxase-like TrwC/TraI family protein